MGEPGASRPGLPPSVWWLRSHRTVVVVDATGATRSINVTTEFELSGDAVELCTEREWALRELAREGQAMGLDELPLICECGRAIPCRHCVEPERKEAP